jgi:Zn-dependent protease
MSLQFELFGIPVRVQPWFLLTAYFIGPSIKQGLANVVVWILVAFVGILLHELGHAFAGRRFGFVPYIELHAFGGLTGWSASRKLTPARDIFISAAGPAVGITIGLLAAFIPVTPGSLAALVIQYVVWVNLGWGLLNLLPILPLDGGHIVASLAEIAWQDRGRRAARRVSIVLTVTLTLWALSTGQIWLTIIGALLTFSNWQALQAEGPSRTPRRRRQPDSQPGLERLGQAFNSGDWPEVVAAAEQILAAEQNETLRAHALYYLAWGRLREGDAAAAREAVAAIPGEMAPDPALTGCLLFEEGDAAAALPHLQESLAKAQDPLAEETWKKAVSATKRFAEGATFLSSSQARNITAETVGELEQAAGEAEEYRAAADLGALLYKRRRNPATAFRVACSLALADLPEEAMGWLETAVNEGFTDLGVLDSSPDLEPLRSLPTYQNLRDRLARART